MATKKTTEKQPPAPSLEVYVQPNPQEPDDEPWAYLSDSKNTKEYLLRNIADGDGTERIAVYTFSHWAVIKRSEVTIERL